MARNHEIIQEIMKPGNCIQILDGKKFGTLLGELLKMLQVADEKTAKFEALHTSQARHIARLTKRLEMRTPDGLRHNIGDMLKNEPGVTVVKVNGAGTG